MTKRMRKKTLTRMMKKMKIKCPVCEDKFRHYYLVLRHVKDVANEEDILIKDKKLKYGAHLHTFDKILSKCAERVKRVNFK